MNERIRQHAISILIEAIEMGRTDPGQPSYRIAQDTWTELKAALDGMGLRITRKPRKRSTGLCPQVTKTRGLVAGSTINRRCGEPVANVSTYCRKHGGRHGS